MGFLEQLFTSPTTAVPAWLISIAFAAYVLDKLAQGKIGQFVGRVVDRRANREARREDALFSILREMIQEQSKEVDEIRAMLHEVNERLVSLAFRSQELRNLLSMVNQNMAQLTDETRNKFEAGTGREFEILEKIKSLYAFLVQRDSN